jgi:hypothetical protein
MSTSEVGKLREVIVAKYKEGKKDKVASLVTIAFLEVCHVSDSQSVIDIAARLSTELDKL